NLCYKPSRTLSIDQSTPGLVEGQRTIANHQPIILSPPWDRDGFRGSTGREEVQRIPRLQPVKTGQCSLHVSANKTTRGHGGHGQQSAPWGCQTELRKSRV